MNLPHRIRLKVCCIQSEEEARLAVSLGADCLGLVAAMPSGPGPIDDDRIARIARSVPQGIATFLLTSRTDPEALVDHVRRCACSHLQICDMPHPDAYAHLRRNCPGTQLVQVIHVQDEQSVEEAGDAARAVDLLLLDSGRTRGVGKGAVELGGTGRTHDWALSRRIVSDSPVPVFLAGGLREENVAEAVSSVRPSGVDLCNGVRTAGELDAAKLAAFVRALRLAESSHPNHG
jgi:phosphoribosylanthranilate isomerase